MNPIQITPAQLIIAIISSAGIGAVVTGSLLAFSQWRERISRQNELILSKSVELAMKHTEVRMKMAEGMGRSVDIVPEIVIARFYHRQLTRLFNKHQISSDMEKEFYEIIHRVPYEPREEVDKGV
jgi:hypothetical protein